MPRFEITTGAQVVTTPGPVTPTTGLDISGIAAGSDFTLEIEVGPLTAVGGAAKARVVLEDSVNAFTASIPVVEWDVRGPVQSLATMKKSWRAYELPSLRIGVANAVLRANVVSIAAVEPATSPSLTVHASLES